VLQSAGSSCFRVQTTSLFPFAQNVAVSSNDCVSHHLHRQRAQESVLSIQHRSLGCQRLCSISHFPNSGMISTSSGRFGLKACSLPMRSCLCWRECLFQITTKGLMEAQSPLTGLVFLALSVFRSLPKPTLPSVTNIHRPRESYLS
jgi:hypothetical protein